MYKFVAVIGAVMALLGPSVADTSEDVAAPAVSLKLQSALGTGCPAGTTAVVSVDDKYALGVNYTAFDVNGDDYTNCQLVIDVGMPSGYTFAAYAVNQGYARISSGALGKIQTTSYLTGSPWTSEFTRTIKGPYEDSWTASSDDGDLQWAPCNTDRLLNINNVLRVDGPASNFMSMTKRPSGARASTVVHIRWRAC